MKSPIAKDTLVEGEIKIVESLADYRISRELREGRTRECSN